MTLTTFIMEQHIGHRSYYENLRRYIDQSANIDPEWIEVTYQESWGRSKTLRFIPERLRGSLDGRAQVRNALMHTNSDIAFFNTQVPAALGGSLARKLPYVLSTDITPKQYDSMATLYGHKPDSKGLISRYKHFVNKKLFRGASFLFPWSSWAAESLIDDYHVELQKVEVLPPGVDTNFWIPANNPENERVRILFIGGDFYRKGGLDLMEAFRSLPAGMAELVLVTHSAIELGEGISVYKDMKPNTAELVELCQTCDVFVLPSKAEAFGIAAVEASALGLPVIAAKVGGLGDIVADGENGYLIPPGDRAALAQRLLVLAENPSLRRAYGMTSRQRAIRSFDARKNSSRLIDILHEVKRESIQ
jgi:glycosyltransferase involved in cell wall biosynthesis